MLAGMPHLQDLFAQACIPPTSHADQTALGLQGGHNHVLVFWVHTSKAIALVTFLDLWVAGDTHTRSGEGLLWCI